MPDLDIVEFVEEAVEITNKPPLSGKWGMYVLFVDQPMGVDSVFVTIESEKQKRDGMLVSSMVFPVTCTEIIVQDPMLKQVYAFYIQQGNSEVELHQDIGIVNVYLQLGTSQHTVAVAKGSEPVYRSMGPTRSRGGKNAEMGAGDATNRVFATTTHKRTGKKFLMRFCVKPLQKGDENSKVRAFTQVCDASTFQPDEDEEDENAYNYKQIRN